MKIFTKIALLLLASVLLVTGCETSDKRGTSRMKIELLPGGDMQVAGKVCKLSELPTALRKAGAGSGTSIIIQTPEGTTDAERSKVGSVLLTAKYRKFIFAGARQVTVSTGPTTTTSTTIKPASTSTTTSTKTTTKKTSTKTSTKK